MLKCILTFFPALNVVTGPGVELVSCDLLREGAPIEPVPPVTHWKPDAVVREDACPLPPERVVGLLFCIYTSLFRYLSAARVSVQVSCEAFVKRNQPIHLRCHRNVS